jgi:hypothetical protein
MCTVAFWNIPEPINDVLRMPNRFMERVVAIALPGFQKLKVGTGISKTSRLRHSLKTGKI